MAVLSELERSFVVQLTNPIRYTYYMCDVPDSFDCEVRVNFGDGRDRFEEVKQGTALTKAEDFL